eukprot:2099882-Karenia_brevis.AAC.1
MDAHRLQRNGGDEWRKARRMLQGLPKHFRVHGLRFERRSINARNLDGPATRDRNNEEISDDDNTAPDTNTGRNPVVVQRSSWIYTKILTQSVAT